MKRSLSGVFAALLIASNAYAADLAPAEPIAPPEVTVTEATGWYLRGDVGYGFNDLRGAKYFQGSNASEVDFDRADVDDAWTIGGGVGYQINSYLRTDLTLDYLGKSDFNGSTNGGGAGVGGGACSFSCSSTDISSMTAWSLMANAYVDLGTYGYVTPYVGAGIGGTYVKWKDLNNTSCDTSGSGIGCDPTVTHGGKGSWRFSYGLMAGASIDVTCNVKADVGYRYLRVNGGDMFGYNLNGGPGRDKGFNIHEARVGARYMFGGCQTASYEPPPEIPLQQPVYK
ncbi:outer membrane protein [Rhizobium metallidurans]|uniref:Opacity protein-like surface antigen n=1 Tax=Rhizobium metallidurans TaxID=1265931 RepID=A0A7W6CPM7_9HYPH|nr:outer membrane protein [Rhizobium metallidurans]MBB3964892.1 opacity protein-like surface antigen [Rhizobium metallidurans]